MALLCKKDFSRINDNVLPETQFKPNISDDQYCDFTAEEGAVFWIQDIRGLRCCSKD